ncbi:peptidase S8/S53 domain-containing protein [Dactylonectria macrodidyma]|uniref:Peptidase S8/S53 domain-containing protein n=1 Tax=Dactylonectria macrodidyma TaxID=307937 RepID=A0A9P9EYG5_9HYPO|nr:peptidase S8/S53 domain-containing protein [Dactylonectria macrodidyma]
MQSPWLLLLLAADALARPTVSTHATSDIVKGKYIVIVKPELAAPKLNEHIGWVDDIHKRSLSRRAGAAESGVNRVWSDTFKGYSGEFDTDTIKEINKNDDVLSVEPVRVIKIYAPKVTQSPATWNLGAISHRTAGSREYVYESSAGKDMWAYVVDTGVYAAHTEFEGRAFAGYNAVPNTKNIDVNGHGTHCAGIIASKTYGVAKQANIMAVKVLDGASSTTDIVLDGFMWAVSNITNTPGRAAKSVISLSLGGGKSAAFNAAIDAAYKLGILVSAAAGNNNVDAALSSPGSAASAITVGATDKNNIRASFSNFGKVVDVFAPGLAITSLGITSVTATATMSGTSMACPHVAGLALYLKAKETLSAPGTVISRIKNLATKNVVLIPGLGSPNLLVYNGAA